MTGGKGIGYAAFYGGELEVNLVIGSVVFLHGERQFGTIWREADVGERVRPDEIDPVVGHIIGKKAVRASLCTGEDGSECGATNKWIISIKKEYALIGGEGKIESCGGMLQVVTGGLQLGAVLSPDRIRAMRVQRGRSVCLPAAAPVGWL